jgi:hypothetical protein
MGIALRHITLFEYSYRDASNYKAWGNVLLEGSGGPTRDDHVWRIFHGVGRAESNEADRSIYDTVESFVSRVEATAHWNAKLSPPWDL